MDVRNLRCRIKRKNIIMLEVMFTTDFILLINWKTPL